MASRRLGALAVGLALAVVAGIATEAAAAPDHAQGASPVASALPDDSLFRLDVRLAPSGGGSLRLDSFVGRPTLVAMFYSSCTSVCPMLTLEMQRIEAALGPDERERVRFLLISMDPERDTPAALAAFAAEHHFDPSRWLVAHASANDVRTLAAALGVRYRQLPDRSFSHSSIITLLDSQGVPRARISAPSNELDDFLSHVRGLLR